MGIKKQDHEQHNNAESALKTGLLGLLQDSGKADKVRLRIASNALHNLSCTASVYRLTVDWLLRRCHDNDDRFENATAAVLAECLSSPGVLLLLEDDSCLLLTLLTAAVSGDGFHHRQFCLSGQRVDSLMVAVAAAAERVTASPDDRGAALVFSRLCHLLSSATVVTRIGGGSERRRAYLQHLLVPSLRVSARRPDLTAACAAVFTTLALSDGDVPSRLLCLASRSDAATSTPDSDPEATQLLSALYNLSVADSTIGGEMMAVLGCALLGGGQPLLALALLASRAGLVPSVPGDGAERPPLLPVPLLEPVTQPLPEQTRLLLMARLCVCVRDLRISLTASYQQVILLEWLRALAADLLSPDQQHTAAWFGCMSELLRISPHVLPLTSRLGQLIAVAMTTAADGDAPAGAAAAQLLQLVIGTYADLHQLPRLLPQLLLVARQREGLRLAEPELETLARRVSLMPQAHLPHLWKTMLYHLTDDVLKRMEAGGEPTDAPSSAVTVTCQLTTCLLRHAAVIDQSTTTAATRHLLAPLMTQTYATLSQVAALLADIHSCRGYVGGVMSVCVAWCQLHVSLMQYCAEYRTAASHLSPNQLLSPLSAAIGRAKIQRGLAAEELQRLIRDAVAIADTAVENGDIAGSTSQRPALLSDADYTAADQLPDAAELERCLPADAETWHLQARAVVLLAKALAKATKKAGPEGARISKIAGGVLETALSALQDGSPVDQYRNVNLDESITSTLSSAGDLLESGATVEVDSAFHRSVCAALKLLLNMPLESMANPWPSHLLTLVCLCLMLSVKSGGQTPRKRSSDEHDGRLKKKKAKLGESVMDASDVMADTLPTNISVSDSSETSVHPPRQLALTALSALCYGCRHDASSLAALQTLQPRKILSWLETARMTSQSADCDVTATQLSDVTRAVLAACAGPALPQLTSYAGGVVSQVKEGNLELRQVGTLVELLQHCVTVNDALKGADPDIKAHAKALSTCLPRLMSASSVPLDQLPASILAHLFSGWSLLIHLRAHKPSGASRPQWRRLLSDIYPLALKFATGGDTHAIVGGEEGSEDVSAGGLRLNGASTTASPASADGTAGIVGCDEAWSLLTAACSRRELLAEDLPSSVVLDVWECANTASVAPSVDTVKAVMSSASSAELEQMLSELQQATEAQCVEASDHWRRPLSLWRALAETVFPEADSERRHRQWAGLQWVVPRLCHTVARRRELWDAAGISGHLLPTLHATSAVVRQKGVVVSDVTLTASLLACHPQFCSSLSSDQVAFVLQTIASLLEKLCAAQRGFVVNRIPLLTQAIAYVFQQACARSRPGCSDSHQAALLAACNAAGRALRQLCRLRQHVEPVAPLLLADLLQLMTAPDAPLPAPVQESVTRSLYLLLTLCRDEVVTRLRVTVPPPMRPLLHTTIVGYKRYFKFAGRV